jgi:hypothetical protein
MTASCYVCGKDFRRARSHIRRVKHPTCSRRCNGIVRSETVKLHAHKARASWTQDVVERWREKVSGPLNKSWRGGVTRARKKGNYYAGPLVKSPEWALPMAQKHGYIGLHRLTVAELCGRLLTRTEVVHHRDHDPRNNAPENLELWPTNAAHKKAEWGIIPVGACNVFSWETAATSWKRLSRAA